MSVEWQKNITSNSYIDHVYDLETDTLGNVYSLGSFPIQATISGQTLYGSTGEHLLTKHDTSGNLMYGINFGGQTYIDEGELEVSKDFDLTIALNYKGNFYWHDTILASSPNFTAIILKLDSSLNLLWYEEAPCLKVNFAQLYTDGMVQDEAENVYTCIRYIDSILIDGTIYTNNGTAYGLVLSKFDASGDHLWTKQYQSESGTILSKIILAYNPNVTGISEIIMAGYHPADTIYIDTVAYFLDTIGGAFVTKVDNAGNILESVRIRNVDYIIDFGFYENRVFFAGMFYDTIHWQGGFTVPTNESAFIGEFNDSLELLKIIDIKTSSPLYLNGFNVSDKYGFMLHGNYHNSLSIQSSLISQVSSPPNGVFIATLDAGFILNEVKYVPASFFSLRKVRVLDTLVYGAGIFENSLNFANATNSGWNEDIVLFRVNGINQLSSFEGLSVEEEKNGIRNLNVFPNPSSEILYFSDFPSINDKEVLIYDPSGKLVLQTSIHQNSIVISELLEGFYFLKVDGIYSEPIKFLKK
jgi:hypothetical protein